MEQLALYGEKWARRYGRSPYPVMNVDDIADLPMIELAARDSMLAMWCTAPMIADGNHDKVISGWGFTNRTIGFTWIKLNPSGIGLFYGQGYHCLDANGKVYIQTQGGWVEELTIGQLYERNEPYLIHTHQGWRQLKAIWSNGLKPTVILRHRFGEIGCTSNHRWAIKSLSTHRQPDGPRQRVHQISYETVDWLNQKAALKTYQGDASLNLIWNTTPVVSQQPETCFDEFELDYETGWLIGLYAAEGSCQENQMRFTLHLDETHLVEHLSRIVAGYNLPQDRYFNHLVKVRTHQVKNQNTQVAYFASRRLKVLIKAYVEGDEATCKRLNLVRFLQTTIEFRQGFIDGLLAGDGTKNNHPELYGLGYRGFVGLASASEQLILNTLSLLRTMGVMSLVDPAEDKLSPYSGADCKLYHLRFPHPRNQSLYLDGQHVLPVRYDGLETGLIRPTFDLSVEDEAFVVDGLVSHNTHQNAEYLFLARRGNGVSVRAHDIFSLIFWPRGEHSAKPPIARERLEKLYGNVSRIELFARQQVPGWSSWGNEVPIIPGSIEETVLSRYVVPPYTAIVDEDEYQSGISPLIETYRHPDTYAPGEQMRMF